MLLITYCDVEESLSHHSEERNLILMGARNMFYLLALCFVQVMNIHKSFIQWSKHLINLCPSSLNWPSDPRKNFTNPSKIRRLHVHRYCVFPSPKLHLSKIYINKPQFVPRKHMAFSKNTYKQLCKTQQKAEHVVRWNWHTFTIQYMLVIKRILIWVQIS